jgi:chloramphenicol 3-O phosphotransferase
VASGQVVVLNGAPRSGKSSIARALIDRRPGHWLNLGVDTMQAATPTRLLPGMGLSPRAARPDLEPFVVAAFEALYVAVRFLSQNGVGVAVDVGHHHEYSQRLGILQRSARLLADVPVLFVGVHCDIDELMARRAATWEGEPVRERVRLWEEAVHRPGIYDLELDTSQQSADACCRLIEARLAIGPGTAFTEADAVVGRT